MSGKNSPGGGNDKGVLSMNKLSTSPNNNKEAAANKSRTQHELMAMMVERNIQTAGGQRARPTLKSNLAPATNANQVVSLATGRQQQKFIKRPNKFVSSGK